MAGLRRRLLSLGVAVAALAGLVACQAIPGSGPVNEGLTSLDQAEQPVQFDPGGPSPGASQEEVVRGFVRAAASSVDDYAISREFLTPEYAGNWDPAVGVFVDEGTQPYRSIDDHIGELSLTGLATVDAAGTLTPLPQGPETTMRFEFEEIDGEWRIASAPNGIILAGDTFATTWTPRQLYFVTADNRLVPEMRWFLKGATLATQIVSALLAGPSDADVNALRTAFPSGSELASRAVPISSGNALIELSAELLSTDPETMELAKRQLATSLQSVPGVSGFEISINGAVVERGAVEAPQGDVRSVEFLQPVVLKEGILGTLGPGKFQSLPRIGGRIAELRPNAVSLNSERSAAAVRHGTTTGQTVSLVVPNDVVTLDVRRGVLAPSLDPFGYVWSFATSEPKVVMVERPGDDAAFLSLPGLNGRVPVAVRVSPGGNRIAMLLSDGAGGSSAMVASIVRDVDSKPVSLAERATRTMDTEGEPVDLDWVDEMRLVTLSDVGSGVKVTLGTIGHLPIDNGIVPDAITVSGGGSRALMRLLDSDGELFAPQGSGWQRQAEEIELLARTG